MRSLCSTLCFAALASAPAWAFSAQTAPQPLKAVPAVVAAGTSLSAFDGVVEAVRQTVVSAQVAGPIVQLSVRTGDRVQAGQVLLRIDARAAEQEAAATGAQAQAAQASLALAAKDFERQQQLFQKSYISQAALERAEAVFKSAQAQAQAQRAQADATRTQSGYYTVRAPFAGLVSEVPVSLGDMAMPGRPLLSVYDPRAMRVTAAVPQSALARLAQDARLRIELPGPAAASAWVSAAGMQVLPTVDAGTHTVQLRAELPGGMEPAAPGMFARLWLPLARGDASGPSALSVPLDAVVRRAELTGLYVLDPQGRPVLRQVRLGRAADGRVEVQSGLAPGEQVVTDPRSAARLR